MSQNPAFSFLVMPLFICSIFGIAGALAAAMLFAFFSMDLQGVRLAAGVILAGLVTSIFDAIKVGIFTGFPLGFITGLATTVIEKRKQLRQQWEIGNGVAKVVEMTIYVVCGVAVTAYFIRVLSWMVLASFNLSTWGSSLGMGVGILIGGWLSYELATDKRAERMKPTRLLRRPGTHANDLDWWMAEVDDDSDAT